MKTRFAFLAGRRSIEGRNRNVRSGAGLVVAGAVLACACAASAATFEPWPEPDSSADEAVVAAAAGGQHQHRADGDRLDPLRTRAATGDADSGVQLVQQLIDRYESGHAKDDLFEAVLWIDRFHGTEPEAHSGVVERVSSRHCDEKVLRFHWLCEIVE